MLRKCYYSNFKLFNKSIKFSSTDRASNSFKSIHTSPLPKTESVTPNIFVPKAKLTLADLKWPTFYNKPKPVALPTVDINKPFDVIIIGGGHAGCEAVFVKPVLIFFNFRQLHLQEWVPKLY